MMLNFCRVVNTIACTYNSAQYFKLNNVQIVILVSVTLNVDSDLVLVFYYDS